MPRVADDELIDTIRSAVIGDDEAIATPFGVRRVTYAGTGSRVPVGDRASA
jgi:hypothetical protein